MLRTCVGGHVIISMKGAEKTKRLEINNRFVTFR